MIKNARSPARDDSKLVEVKSKYYVEFRRYSLNRAEISKFEEFYKQIETVHNLQDIAFTICYTDPKDGSLLPINNDDNYTLAINSARPLLRLIIQKKGESWEEINGYGSANKKKNFFSQYLTTPLGGHSTKSSRPHISISFPEDFRQVSAIIDVDIVPETCIRVQLLKHGSEKPLGFFIRDGTSVRVTPQGLEKVPGIFISRLLPGGLAESTGLLAVNDEVMEVNGIRVDGKTLDQVTDMMVANSSNLIITVKPGDNSNVKAPRRGSFSRTSQMSAGSHQSSVQSMQSDEDRFDNDEIRDLTVANETEMSETSPSHSDSFSSTTINESADNTVVTL